MGKWVGAVLMVLVTSVSGQVVINEICVANADVKPDPETASILSGGNNDIDRMQEIQELFAL